MTTRVQETSWLRNETAKCKPLCALEKAMMRHAIISPSAKVLDANVCSGKVAEYLLRNLDCQVCGVSDRLEQVRRTRMRMCGGDFVYAAIGDIPWQDHTFDTVLLHPSEGDLQALGEQLRECERVLKPGGQLVFGLRSLPPVLAGLNRFLSGDSLQEDRLPAAQEARQLMEALGFEQVSQIGAGLIGTVFVARTKKEA